MVSLSRLGGLPGGGPSDYVVLVQEEPDAGRVHVCRHCLGVPRNELRPEALGRDLLHGRIHIEAHQRWRERVPLRETGFERFPRLHIAESARGGWQPSTTQKPVSVRSRRGSRCALP